MCDWLNAVADYVIYEQYNCQYNSSSACTLGHSNTCSNEITVNVME